MMEIRLIATLVVVFTTPGVAFLSLAKLWDHYSGLQRHIFIFGISACFYPLLFYTLKILPFNFPLGPYKLAAFLLLCWGIAIYRQRWTILSLFQFEASEWIALFVIAATLATRLWVAYLYPFPAWVDSVHHVMLTRLIATQGQLPSTLEPYYPIPLELYHLGLHSASAVTAWLAQVPFHSALLWTAQWLNGLCGLGVYFVLDRKANRVSAIIGAAVVGLLCYQPAHYVNWGRFTQIASQTLLPIVWLVTVETVDASARAHSRLTSRQFAWLYAVCGLLNAGIVVYHLRVAIFYGTLLLPSLFHTFWLYRRSKNKCFSLLNALFIIACLSLAFIAPALLGAVRAYVQMTSTAAPSNISQEQLQSTIDQYYNYDWLAMIRLAGEEWIWILAALSLLIGLIRRNPVTYLMLTWVMLLILLGNTYLLGIPILNIVNLSGIVIGFYIPFALLIGLAWHEFTNYLAPSRQWLNRICTIAILLAILPFFSIRVNQIETFRYFVTPGDSTAQEWLRENTSPASRIAVNTDFWLPMLPHGADAGYWIPYFASRKVTAGAMLMNLADHTYQNQVIEESRLVIQINDNPAVLAELYHKGIHYIYNGAKGHYTPGKGFDVPKLKTYKELTVVYEKDGVTIFEILPPTL